MGARFLLGRQKLDSDLTFEDGVDCLEDITLVRLPHLPDHVVALAQQGLCVLDGGHGRGELALKRLDGRFGFRVRPLCRLQVCEAFFVAVRLNESRLTLSAVLHV